MTLAMNLKIVGVLLIPGSQIAEPPWGDREWIDRQGARDEGLFAHWPLLAPQLLSWKAEVLG